MTTRCWRWGHCFLVDCRCPSLFVRFLSVAGRPTADDLVRCSMELPDRLSLPRLSAPTSSNFFIVVCQLTGIVHHSISVITTWDLHPHFLQNRVPVIHRVRWRHYFYRTMVVATTPCCRYEKHCNYLRFIQLVNRLLMVLGYFCSSKRSRSRHGGTRVIFHFTERCVCLQHGVVTQQTLILTSLSPSTQSRDRILDWISDVQTVWCETPRKICLLHDKLSCIICDN